MYDHVPTKFERRRRLFFKCKHSYAPQRLELHNPDIECRCLDVESLAGGAGDGAKAEHFGRRGAVSAEQGGKDEAIVEDGQLTLI